jgi:ABC-2 type transport system ATP-binding protein
MVSTHYMEEAEYCHRLALMNRGRLVALDTPSALRAQMREPIVAVTTDNPPAAVRALRDLAGVEDVTMFGRVLHAVVGDEAAARAAIPARLAATGIGVSGMSRIEPSLEDVFASLVRREGGVVAG